MKLPKKLMFSKIKKNYNNNTFAAAFLPWKVWKTFLWSSKQTLRIEILNNFNDLWNIACRKRWLPTFGAHSSWIKGFPYVRFCLEFGIQVRTGKNEKRHKPIFPNQDFPFTFSIWDLLFPLHLLNNNVPISRSCNSLNRAFDFLRIKGHIEKQWIAGE